MFSCKAPRTGGLLLVFSLIGLILPGEVRANIIWMTPSGSTTSGGNVQATCDFTLSNNTVSLLLSNLEGNVISDSQTISGITFSVTSAAGSGALTTFNSGNISTIDTGTSNYTAGVSDALTRWMATESGTTIGLTTLTGGQPNRLIIGPDNMGGFDPNVGQYTNANPSVSNHNPNVLGTASFAITVPGVTSASQISGVSFKFGTASTPESVTGQVVPEPSTLMSLFIAAIVGLFVARRKTRR